MAKISIVFGLLLIVLGVGTYLAAPEAQRSPTALIPSLAGILLTVLGAAALKPAIRKHAMHGAAMVGLLGFLASAGKFFSIVAKTGALPDTLKTIGMGGMMVLCLLFVVLCVKSFVDARRAGAV